MFIAREKGEPRSPLREASIYVLALRFHGMKQSGALMETAINNVNNAKPKTTKTIPPKIKAPAVPPREVVGTIVCRALGELSKSESGIRANHMSAQLGALVPV